MTTNLYFTRRITRSGQRYHPDNEKLIGSLLKKRNDMKGQEGRDPTIQLKHLTLRPVLSQMLIVLRL